MSRRSAPICASRARLRGVLLLLAAPLLPAALVDAHGFHAAGQPETKIWVDARHAGQADHWEAAERVQIRRCAACLAPAKLRGLMPDQVAGARPPVVCGPATAAAVEPAQPVARRPGRPRAPPLS